MFVLQVLCMIFIKKIFNVTNNNFSFQIYTSIGIVVQVLQPYPYLHASVFSTNFLPWSLIVYILPWCCACISCKTNKRTILYYCFTFKQKSQWIICTINFLCVYNLQNTRTVHPSIGKVHQKCWHTLGVWQPIRAPYIL